jgi:hypothetical protein
VPRVQHRAGAAQAAGPLERQACGTEREHRQPTSQATTWSFTYKGPRRVGGDSTRHVREVVKTGDFESVRTWTIGLDDKRPFKVVTSDAPPRLAVEIG